ncbi:MAG: glutamine synthetase type III [Deltaproteobacteria bacterium]|nr:MAG: glutamine synthetase type III [Deltaproteobacteria bacterium]
MSGNQSRQDAIKAVTNYRPATAPLSYAEEHVGGIFGSNVFSLNVMEERLPKKVFLSIKKTIETSGKLDPSIADVVASAMKDWAVSKGATHYTHVFYPLTGLTAEKHDSFLSPDGKGGAMAEFSGKLLIQGESDASSFPSGGLRATFEARGYTAWDVTNPAYILENPNGTFLCIPTAFVSWTGEALDKKTPLLRSSQALNAQARRVLALFGSDTGEQVQSFAGAEQEYFLVDRNFYFERPDLQLTGRTLFGAKPAKGQELDDHYFGAIPERVLSFMMTVEHELYKLGIPVKTRHNEVAPGQFEIAPLYEQTNLANDHNQSIMTTLKGVAKKYGMACLLHEKPFAGINGSGKHLNYSIGTKSLGSLFDPGDTPHENLQFLLFCAAVIRGVHLHGDLLRAVVATAGNDHRLGANEAPPAIMSVYLGEQLTDIFEQITSGTCNGCKTWGDLRVGVDTLPPLPMDAGDRNRTSPFAFTGNRFEFRAVGSNLSIAGPLVAMNTLLTESLDWVATRLEALDLERPDAFKDAVLSIIKEIITDHGDIIFNGNGYSEAWQEEAARRGLPCFATAVDALPVLTSPSAVNMFTTYGVFSHRELTSRQEVYLEQYSQHLVTEGLLTVKMARTIILPAVLRFTRELADTSVSLKALGIDDTMPLLQEITAQTQGLYKAIGRLEELLDHGLEDPLEKARYMGDKVIPVMLDIRTRVDALEDIVADDLWPLPTYQEMLFIK